MTSANPSLCLACTRYDSKVSCTSFPTGIPEPILRYAFDHHESIGGELPFDLNKSKQKEYDQWDKYGSKNVITTLEEQ